jgi:hypothetical protein
MLPPYNHFEIAALRDKTLGELGIPDIDESEVAVLYSMELLKSALSGQEGIISAVALVSKERGKNNFGFYWGSNQ